MTIEELTTKWIMPQDHTPTLATVPSIYGTAVINASSVSGVRTTVMSHKSGGVVVQKPFRVDVVPGFTENGEPVLEYSFSLFLASTMMPLFLLCCCCFCVRRLCKQTTCCSGRQEEDRDQRRYGGGGFSQRDYDREERSNRFGRRRRRNGDDVGFRSGMYRRDQIVQQDETTWAYMCRCIGFQSDDRQDGGRGNGERDRDPDEGIELDVQLYHNRNQLRPPRSNGTDTMPEEPPLKDGQEPCAICCVRAASRMFMPCEHGGVCQTCAVSCNKLGNGCPFCRCDITHIIVAAPPVAVPLDTLGIEHVPSDEEQEVVEMSWTEGGPSPPSPPRTPPSPPAPVPADDSDIELPSAAPHEMPIDTGEVALEIVPPEPEDQVVHLVPVDEIDQGNQDNQDNQGGQGDQGDPAAPGPPPHVL